MGKCAIIGAKCPQTSDPNAKVFCPLWNDTDELFMLENVRTGQQKVERCGARVMVKGQIEVIKASNRPAAAVEQTRNDIAEGFARLAQAMNIPFKPLRQTLPANGQQYLPRHGPDG